MFDFAVSCGSSSPELWVGHAKRSGPFQCTCRNIGPIGVVQIKTVTLTWVKRIQGPNPFAISYVNGKTVVTGLDQVIESENGVGIGERQHRIIHSKGLLGDVAKVVPTRDQVLGVLQVVCGSSDVAHGPS